jgi:hypothetical protein
MERSEIYEQALEWGKNNYPDAPEVHHSAFASVVRFACTFVNRQFVIETMRSLVAMDILHRNYSFPLEFEQALCVFAETCYGDITLEHAQKYKHDRPEGEYGRDIKSAKTLIETLHSTVIYNAERD